MAIILSHKKKKSLFYVKDSITELDSLRQPNNLFTSNEALQISEYLLCYCRKQLALILSILGSYGLQSLNQFVVNKRIPTKSDLTRVQSALKWRKSFLTFHQNIVLKKEDSVMHHLSLVFTELRNTYISPSLQLS